jgi:hypothetical protein
LSERNIGAAERFTPNCHAHGEEGESIEKKDGNDIFF